MTMRIMLAAVALYVAGAGLWLLAGGVVREQSGTVLLNVSYDPTRELWRDLNERFAAAHRQQHGQELTLRQSHGGSSTQARAVLDGLEADVVTLALWPDTDALRKKGLIDAGWEDRLPHRSLPYFSTIVFVVRKGNPRAVRDWSDLVRPGLQVVTPNPKTSGNGKLAFLAAWGAEQRRTRSEDAARDFVTRLYRNVPALDTGARGATTTFAQKGIGDVHLTWENEAYLEVQEAAGELEIVYPPSGSIRAEPHVAVVDAVVRRKGTRAAAEAYLRFLYTAEAQEVIARHRLRPIDPDVRLRHSGELPDLPLFAATELGDWDTLQTRFFGDGGEFDRIFESRGK